MYLSEIALQQFRSHHAVRYTLAPSLTLIVGQNGTGKTNLLEAIHVLYQGGSFRVGDRDMIENDQQWWRVDGVISGEPRQVRYQLGHHPPKQLAMHDTTKRFMHKDKLPVVLFEPNDLLLIHGSPTRRRDALDTMLSALNPTYKATLGKYERALKQRNNALKSPSAPVEDSLFSWDILLSDYGVEISLARQQLARDINSRIGGYYSAIAGSSHDVTVKYRTALGDTISTSRFMAGLREKQSLDLLRGTTSIGPHRDDMSFSIEGNDMNVNASRGEVRSALLALKLTYASLLEMVYNQLPLILLDDVFSELDNSRQMNLLHLLAEHQTIITDTRELDIPHGAYIKLT